MDFARVEGVEPTNNAAERSLITYLRARSIVQGGRADEQRGRALVASRGDLAQNEWGHGQRGRQPIRGAGDDRGGDVPPTEAEHTGIPERPSLLPATTERIVA